MTNSIDTFPDCNTSEWDRYFLSLSSCCAAPLCKAYELLRYRLIAPLSANQFDHCTTRTREVGLRVCIASSAALCIIGAPLLALGAAAFCAVSSKIFRCIGFALQTKNFTHVRGTCPEQPIENTLKLMTWNICGATGGFHYNRGGVIGWEKRLEKIVQRIESEDPGVLVLEEIYDAALGEALIERLKDRYAHFFFHMGSTLFGSVGGVMVLSKHPVHHFSNENFTTNNWTLARGFATLQLKAKPTDLQPAVQILGTHLIHGESKTDMENRQVQVQQMINSVKAQSVSIPTIFCGDFNIERDGEEGLILTPFLRHGYQDPAPTCTNRLVAQWDQTQKSVWGETIDYISSYTQNPECAIRDCRIVPAFDEDYDTSTALSDHHGLVATLELPTHTPPDQPVTASV